jgi:hypothetical protein
MRKLMAKREGRPTKLELHAFELSKHYENLAVHFNDLILGLGIQALVVLLRIRLDIVRKSKVTVDEIKNLNPL